jgi:hypothetical protein
MIALDEAQLRLASSALPARQQQPKASIFLLGSSLQLSAFPSQNFSNFF